MGSYYAAKGISHPSPQLFGLEGLEKSQILMVGTHVRQDWAFAIDVGQAGPTFVVFSWMKSE